MQYSFSVESIPDRLQFFVTIIFALMSEDFMYHFCHKFLHWGPVYTYVHKQHHSYLTTIGLAGEYCHPIEYAIAGFLPSTLAAILLGKRMHFSSVLIWSAVKTIETVESHSGYWFSWSPYRLVPLVIQTSYHDYHHTHNVGCYSSTLSFWDTVFGNNREYFKYIEEREKVEEAKKVM
jgi:sterol desaturase/sphingolipid hydroxylase (fatty acid hydroxylase superfamily)